MNRDLYRTLRSLLSDREIVISAVPSHLIPQLNGLTALLLHDPNEVPVFEAGVLHNMKYRSFDYAFRHLELDISGLTDGQRVARIGQVLSAGMCNQPLPDTRMPLRLYVENGYRPWMRAAREFQKQYCAEAKSR